MTVKQHASSFISWIRSTFISILSDVKIKGSHHRENDNKYRYILYIGPLYDIVSLPSACVLSVIRVHFNHIFVGFLQAKQIPSSSTTSRELRQQFAACSG